MPEAINSISTNASKIHPFDETNTIHVVDNLLDLSEGLRSFKIMLTSLLDTSGIQKTSYGIGVVLDNLIKDLERQRILIYEDILYSEQNNAQATSHDKNTSATNIAQDFDENVAIIKAVLHNDTSAKTAPITIRLTDEVRQAIDKAAQHDDRSINLYIERIIKIHLFKYGFLQADVPPLSENEEEIATA